LIDASSHFSETHEIKGVPGLPHNGPARLLRMTPWRRHAKASLRLDID
jgi:hypothetical protein